MRWNRPPKTPATAWHRWFAWYPVTVLVDHGYPARVWLEPVMRKCIFSYASDDWAYKLPEDKS